ncbi:MAG: histidine phosphatase family protein [Elusimicrobia bacterium]|nr:histidine phosphatase family protein [Elusimicrobiota bacterium]
MNDGINAVFLRHGHAMTPAESGADSDSRRKLSQRGKEEITSCANKLISIKFNPDLILTSPLVRAMETSKMILSLLNNPCEFLTLEELACQTDPVLLMNAVRPRIINRNFPVIIGHQPLIGALCGYISGSNPIDMHTGAFALVKIDREKLKQNFKSCGKLIDIYNPCPFL